jgi:hypothetical protein
MYFCKSFGGKANRRGLAPPVHNGAYSCSVKKKNTTSVWSCLQNFLILFQPVPVFVGNLTQNSKRLSLSNEPLLLRRSCAYNISSYLLLFHANNILSITFKHETITPIIFGCISSFFQSYAWSYIFTRIFRNSKFSTKAEIMLVFVQTNKFWNSSNSLKR